MLGSVLRWSVRQRGLLLERGADLWERVLPGHGAVPGGALLPAGTGVQPAVLCCGQHVCQQPVCAVWQHTLWHDLLPFR